ncbi:MAG: HEAT repeat domain-containing protein [Planctomycetes bacterium]|nr:HEAT repeat domain-containing protein [Planctomycetota bacterium]
MTKSSCCADATKALAVLLALAAANCDSGPHEAPLLRPSGIAAPRDPRPFTPWHSVDTPLPFPSTEWFWQDLFAVAPSPEPLPADATAAAEIAATLERIASRTLLEGEEELPALVVLARRDLAALIAALDDSRTEVRFAAARVMVRLIAARESLEECPFPQRLVEAAARHLRDVADEVALLHLETIARGGYAWSWPVLLKTFGRVDNHRLTVLRIRAAALLAKQGCLGGVPLLIKALKENTSIQDDLARDWDASFQTAWWKEEAIAGIAALAHDDFDHSPDSSDELQVAAIRRIEAWWQTNRIALWAAQPALTDPELIVRVKQLILALGTFQLRNVDNAAFVLEGIGPPVAPLLFEALAGSSYRVRLHVFAVLANLCDAIAPFERERWLARFVPCLEDSDPAVKVKALEAIGATGVPAALPHLEAALQPENPALCETALRELSRQEPTTAREVLLRGSTRLPPGHLLATPLDAARLRAGDLTHLQSWMDRLRDGDARTALYLSWIVEVDELSDAKNPEERLRALQRIEQAIRARAKS